MIMIMNRRLLFVSLHDKAGLQNMQGIYSHK